MNKRLVQRAMQKLVDQNPSRPLHQHTTITPTTTITPSTTTPRTLSQGSTTLMASSAEAEEVYPGTRQTSLPPQGPCLAS